MEGRLALTISANELVKFLGLKLGTQDAKPHYLDPQYNLSPPCYLPVVTNLQTDNIRYLKWGLIPSWSSGFKNAKGLSSIATHSFKDKPVLQKALVDKRCLILATGFYIWKDSPAGKIPYYVTLKSKKPFLIPGLWESWEEEESISSTCCLITQKPTSALSYFPSEIPLVLKQELINTWLQTGQTENDVLKEDYFIPEIDFEYYPVNRKILKSQENDPRFILKISYLVAEQTKLF